MHFARLQAIGVVVQSSSACLSRLTCAPVRFNRFEKSSVRFGRFESIGIGSVGSIRFGWVQFDSVRIGWGIGSDRFGRPSGRREVFFLLFSAISLPLLLCLFREFFCYPSCGCYCRCCCCLDRYARAGARPRRENNSVPRIFVSLFLSQGTRNKKYNTVTSERGGAVARVVKVCLQEVFGAWTLVLTVLNRSLPIGSMSIVVLVVVRFDLRRGSRPSVYFLGAVRTCCGSFLFL